MIQSLVFYDDVNETLKEADSLYFPILGERYYDAVLNQNRIALANAISLLYLLRKTENEHDKNYWITSEKLCTLLNDPSEGRNMVRMMSNRLSQLKTEANLDPMGVCTWFLNTYLQNNSVVYDNLEYIRFAVRYGHLMPLGDALC